MLSKNRTLVLGIILGVALIMYFVLQNRNHEENFRTNLPAVDTATTDQIVVHPPAGADPITLTKTGRQWIVEGKNRKYAANKNKINALMLSLNKAEVVRVAAKKPDKWKDFKTTKELGSDIQFMQGGKTEADILLGKFEYIPSEKKNVYGQQQGEMLSYARVNDGDEVYAIEGSIALGVGKTVDDFRNRHLLHLDKNAVNKLAFTYTGGDSFTLSKDNGHWNFDDGTPADSTTMVRYLNTLRYLNGRKLAQEDMIQKPASARLTIISNHNDTVQLTVFPVDSVASIIQSSYNPTNPILDEQFKVEERAFVSKKYLKGLK